MHNSVLLVRINIYFQTSSYLATLHFPMLHHKPSIYKASIN
jgi:hypothetical protein